MTEFSESSQSKETKPLPFTTLYHILPNARLPEVMKNGLLAQKDLTNVWGVFMIEPKNFLNYWRGEDSRLLRSIEGPPYALLEITVTPKMMERIKVRSITGLRTVIRELVEEGVISGYFAGKFPDNIPYKNGRYEQLNGLLYEEYAKVHPEAPNFREPVEIINWDKVPPDLIKPVGTFTNVYGVRELIKKSEDKRHSKG